MQVMMKVSSFAPKTSFLVDLISSSVIRNNWDCHQVVSMPLWISSILCACFG